MAKHCETGDTDVCADVDVVLPTRGRTHTLGYAIESVLAQTHARLRLHLVADGCGSEVEALAARFPDPRVRLHAFAKGPGFGYGNRNQVFRGLLGPYVAYMNDDDLLLRDHLEIALAELRAGLELVALRSAAVHWPDTLDPHFFAFAWRAPWAARFLRHWFMGSVNCVHDVRLFERVGYWNDALSRFGDREFYNRARRGAVRTRYVDRITVLRFYALHWDERYASLPEPPQRRYSRSVQDPAWIEALRAAAERPPGVASRRRQLADFLRFGLRSGPRFARFFLEQLTSRRDGARRPIQGPAA